MTIATARPTLLYACFGVDDVRWLTALRAQAEGIDILTLADPFDDADIAFVFAWNVPAGFWRRFTGLRAIFSLGAGIDRMLAAPDLPADVPLVRMVDPGLVAGMREYVALHVLRHHREVDALQAQQRACHWQPRAAPLAVARTVGILGLGELGAACAATLVALGFDVHGWARGPKDLAGITAHHGAEGLADIASRAEILVNLLPLTPETSGILNAALFDRLPTGACLINVGRGGHLVEADLLAALRGGRIAGATLDVFATEPLPADHPFWTEPGVTVTPHNSALTQPETATATMLAILRDHLAGAPLRNVVARERGY